MTNLEAAQKAFKQWIRQPVEQGAVPDLRYNGDESAPELGFYAGYLAAPSTINSGKCCVECRYAQIGKSGEVIMLGSASCRECKYSNGGTGGDPVECNYVTEGES